MTLHTTRCVYGATLAIYDRIRSEPDSPCVLSHERSGLCKVLHSICSYIYMSREGDPPPNTGGNLTSFLSCPVFLVVFRKGHFHCLEVLDSS